MFKDNIVFAGIDFEKIELNKLYKFMKTLNPALVCLVSQPDFGGQIDLECSE